MCFISKPVSKFYFIVKLKLAFKYLFIKMIKFIGNKFQLYYLKFYAIHIYIYIYNICRMMKTFNNKSFLFYELAALSAVI